ncbi:AraC family transcriptional regulator [Rheinheimera texasensis]|uniref:AraC family transcriptional regulator n=1 Tax=Rheinheimera texasensis TaxID=306205 RepID=UPI0004E1E6E2|nr:AraC family transcriptional regulator [Rheinheimera texasensis]
MESARPTHSIYLFDSCALLQSATLHSAAHAHLAHQWTCRTDGEPFSLWCNGQWQQVQQIFIPSLTPHQFADEPAAYLTLLIDAGSTPAFVEALQLWLQNIVTAPHGIDLVRLSQALQARQHYPDPRVRAACTLIQQSADLSQLSAQWLAQQVALSPGRFLHLFSQQTGLPLRKYLRWQKLLRVFRALAAPQPPAFTELALQAGFYDAAHLANEIRQSFGLALSDIVHNSQFFQDDLRHNR